VAEARVTQAGAYVELTGTAILVTQAGAYIEIVRAQINVSQASAYVEIVRPQINVSQAGAYVELISVSLIGPGTRIIYDDIDITEHVHSFQLEAAISQFEVTSLAVADSTHRYVGGLAKWRLALQGWYSGAWDRTMMPDAVANGAPKSAAVLVQAPHPAHAVGARVRYDWPALRARIAAANITGAPHDALAWDAELILSGAPDRTVD